MYKRQYFDIAIAEQQNESPGTFFKSVSPFATASPRASTTNVVTPKGTPVEVLIRGDGLTAQQKSNMNDYMANLYPNARRVGDPTNNYNCHSYAWYSSVPSNKYWMNDPCLLYTSRCV